MNAQLEVSSRSVREINRFRISNPRVKSIILHSARWPEELSNPRGWYNIGDRDIYERGTTIQAGAPPPGVAATAVIYVYRLGLLPSVVGPSLRFIHSFPVPQ